MIEPAPIKSSPLTNLGFFTQTWVLWFNTVYKILSGQSPMQLASYTMATLPPPVMGQIIYISDESGGPTTAFSDGIEWYISQGVIAS